MLETINNRELASATIISLFLIWGISNKDVRSALVSLVSAFFHRTIITQLVLFTAYTTATVLFLKWCGFWNIGQLKNTLIWFVFIGGIQLFNTTKIEDPKLYLQSSFNNHLRLIVFIEFLVAFHSYSYIAELVLVSVTSILAGLSAVSERDESHLRVKKLVDNLLKIIGIYLVAVSVLHAMEEHEKFLSINTLRDFLIPILLSIAILPYIYCFYFYITYERAFIKTRIYTDSKQLQRYAKIQSLIAFSGDPKLIHKWLSFSCIPEFESKETIKMSIFNFKKKQI